MFWKLKVIRGGRVPVSICIIVDKVLARAISCHVGSPSAAVL